MKHAYKDKVHSPTKILATALALVCCLALAGCDAQSDRADSSTPLERAIEPQLDALEKAKNVEDSLQDQVKEREEAMRDQGT